MKRCISIRYSKKGSYSLKKYWLSACVEALAGDMCRAGWLHPYGQEVPNLMDHKTPLIHTVQFTYLKGTFQLFLVLYTHSVI